VGHKETGNGKMFALIANNSKPLRVSLKCDPQLAESLREKYETVVPGYHLNKKHWNTIICTGQLSDEEVRDLAHLSYQLVANV
jgi:predicted DNA-binding protein (MmcQ/YjbR family)